MRGTGPGGQHRNKTESCVRATHIPTGISVVVDERSQHTSKRKALKELERRLIEQGREKKAAARKARRDERIHDKSYIRTYDFKSGLVRDHRSGKTASVKDVLIKGRLDLLYGDGKEPSLGDDRDRF